MRRFRVLLLSGSHRSGSVRGVDLSLLSVALEQILDQVFRMTPTDVKVPVLRAACKR